MMSQPANRFYEFGDFRIDSVERVLLREGELVPLTQKVFDLLLLLVESNGHVVEKERLMKEVWPDTFVEEGNLTQNISVLRKILGDSAEGRQYIQTVPRRGYRFAGSVRALRDDLELILQEHSLAHIVIEEEQEARPTDEPAKPNPAVRTTAVKLSRPGGIHWRSRGALLGMIIFLLVVSIAGGFLLPRLRSHRTSAAPAFSLDNYSWEKLSEDDQSGGMISPDGEFLVCGTRGANGSWSLQQRRLAGLETVTILPQLTSSLWGTTLSHDSSFVYYILADQNHATGTLFKVSVLGGTPRKILERITGGPTLSPDDSRVAFIRNNFKPGGFSALVTASANDGSDERVLEESDVGPELFNPAWSPDGLRIMCTTVDKRRDGSYWSPAEVPAGGGPVKEIGEPTKQHFWWHVWLPDGSGLVMVATDPASAKRQLYFISYPGGAMRRLTNDLNDYGVASISSDGTKLVTYQSERHSEIWVAAASDVNKASKIAGCCVDGVAWTPDGRIVYHAQKEGKLHLWVMDADGSHQQQLSPDYAVDWSPAVSRDGRYIVFLSTRSGRPEIWRTDSDGRNPRQLTTSGPDLAEPRITADGQMIYFSQYKTGRWLLARMSIDGGEPEQVADVEADLWDLSPDGKRVAYSLFDEKLGRWRIAVRSLEGDGSVTYLDTATYDVLLWTTDGQSLIYKDAANQGLDTTLWRQPLDGEKPQRFVLPTSEINYSADWSNDGQHIAFVRGKEVTNIVMLTRLQNGGVAGYLNRR